MSRRRQGEERETPLRAAPYVTSCVGRASDPGLPQPPGQDGPSSLLPKALGAVVTKLSPVLGQRLVEPCLGCPRWLLCFGVGAPGTLAGIYRALQGDLVLQERRAVGVSKTVSPEIPCFLTAFVCPVHVLEKLASPPWPPRGPGCWSQNRDI